MEMQCSSGWRGLVIAKLLVEGPVSSADSATVGESFAVLL